jgi:hypothetical protein
VFHSRYRVSPPPTPTPTPPPLFHFPRLST